MFIKVIGCSQPKWWYKDHVGKEFEVYKDDDKCPDGKCYIIKDINSHGDMGNIPCSDCIVISALTDGNKFVSPVVKPDIQVLQETLDALIISQL